MQYNGIFWIHLLLLPVKNKTGFKTPKPRCITHQHITDTKEKSWLKQHMRPPLMAYRNFCLLVCLLFAGSWATKRHLQCCGREEVWLIPHWSGCANTKGPQHPDPLTGAPSLASPCQGSQHRFHAGRCPAPCPTASLPLAPSAKPKPSFPSGLPASPPAYRAAPPRPPRAVEP